MGTTNASLSPQSSPLRRHQTPTAVAVCTHGMLWQAIVYKDLSQGLGNMPCSRTRTPWHLRQSPDVMEEVIITRAIKQFDMPRDTFVKEQL